MTEQELIKAFYYDGYDISNYKNKMQMVESDNASFIDGREKQAIATIRTFSCTNILFYSNNFAYLVHMLPSETIGKNNKFLSRIEEVKKLISKKNSKRVNILISLGASRDDENKMGYHRLDYINANLTSLVDFCSESDVELNILPVLRSKFLLFDLFNKSLIIENNEKKITDIRLLEAISEKLTKTTKTK